MTHVMILIIFLYPPLSTKAFADSPSFVRQVIVDPPDDWFFINPPMNSSLIKASDGRIFSIQTGRSAEDCTAMEKYRFHDISAISYFSNGKTLNATVWLYHPVGKPPSNATDWLSVPFNDVPWYRILYGMSIAVHSAYDIEGSDYHLRNSWSIDDKNWTTIVEEMPPTTNETKVLAKKSFSNGTFFNEENKYVELSLDLSAATYPNQYSLLFYTIYVFIKDGRLCGLSDISNRVYVPPPDFTMSTSPSHIDLRAGEEKAVSLQIKSNTNTRSEVFLSTNDTDEVELTLSPDKTSIPANGLTTSRLNVKVLENAGTFEYILPISANMSIPTESRIRGSIGSDIMRNSISANTTEESNFTLAVLPPLSPAEQLNIFYDSWLSPISGIWTFLVGVGAVIVPLIIRLYARKKSKDKNLGQRSTEPES
jgi:hypothetical protein